MSYIIIPHIKIQKANALATSWCINACPVFAINMFIHALSAETKSDIESVGIIHHQAQILAENINYQYYPHQYRGASYINKEDYSSKSKGPVLSIQPTVSMHFSVSLLLKMKETSSIPNESTLNNFLREKHLAGGIILEHEKIQYMEYFQKNKIMDYIHGGFFIADESHQLGVTHRLKNFIELTSRYSSEWLYPAVMGYQYLTEPSTKLNVRNNKKHVYAEALVGLVSFHNIMTIKETDLDKYLWIYKWIKEDAFIVTTQYNDLQF